jgi:SAM-dependent methyltransferase
MVGLLSATERPGVLDVGCGDGTLYRRLRSHGYSRYVGIDLSPRAVALAAADARFCMADATAYRPEGPFDAIVFNEILYYLHQPVAEVARYAESLAGGGASSSRPISARHAPTPCCGKCLAPSRFGRRRRSRRAAIAGW